MDAVMKRLINGWTDGLLGCLIVRWMDRWMVGSSD